MRKIKFRAFEKEVMRYDVQNDWSVHGNSFGHVLQDRGTVVMQFTGLLDKNGKEIYEGDIIKYEGKHYAVHFSDFFGQWFGCNELYNDIKNGAEVLGNVMENPELLKS